MAACTLTGANRIVCVASCRICLISFTTDSTLARLVVLSDRIPCLGIRRRDHLRIPDYTNSMHNASRITNIDRHLAGQGRWTCSLPLEISPRELDRFARHRCNQNQFRCMASMMSKPHQAPAYFVSLYTQSLAFFNIYIYLMGSLNSFSASRSFTLVLTSH
jgi:hypothetical protein